MNHTSFRFLGALVVLALTVGTATSRPLGASEATPRDSTYAPRRVLELEEIVVSGNSRVSDADILGRLALAPRDTVDATILEDARLRLLSEYDVLRTVEFATRPGSERGLVILDVTVTERNALVFQTGYGQHDVYGWFLTLLGMRVEPTGSRGTEFALGARLGFRIAGVDGKLEQHGVSDGLGLGGNFHLYSQEHLFYTHKPDTSGSGTGSPVYQFTQDIGRLGTELYLKYELPTSTRFSFGFRLESVRPDSTFVDSESGTEFQFGGFPPALQPDIRNTLITGLFVRYARDTRDLFIYPRSGSFTFLELQSNNSFLGGDEIFGKARLDARKHFDLGSWRVLSSRLAAGVVSRGAPYHERFYIGGIYTVRGFPELSLSPPSGHEGVVIASGELRFPLITAAKAPPRLAGLVFVDAGTGWRWDDPPGSTRVEAAVGYGVRLRLPWVGTLGIDTGIPLTDGRTNDRFYVHAILGFSF